MPRPRMIVVAGPPGSGKTRYFPVTAFGVDAFNIDDRCAQILGSYRAIPRDVRRAVAKECERFVLDHIDRGRSFAVETTLRTTAALEQAELARKNGFATEMRFVATDSIAENLARVLQRAQAGGHGASEREIRAIHQASVTNLRTAVAAFDRVRVYDSTPRWAPPRLVAAARGGRLARQGATPAWLEGALAGSNE
ncbi:MAG TPA: zeta toxin family protein [Polyangiaceae bacterium]|nr:zeta toxin family protein [Polyangiaceae bacterium]